MYRGSLRPSVPLVLVLSVCLQRFRVFGQSLSVVSTTLPPLSYLFLLHCHEFLLSDQVEVTRRVGGDVCRVRLGSLGVFTRTHDVWDAPVRVSFRGRCVPSGGRRMSGRAKRCRARTMRRVSVYLRRGPHRRRFLVKQVDLDNKMFVRRRPPLEWTGPGVLE